MPVIRSTDSRRTETPNAVMITLASPTQGQASTSVWRVEMEPGQAGPLHAFDAEQVWTVLSGGASVLLGADVIQAGPGDTLVLPPDVPRKITADARVGLTAVCAAPAGLRAYALDGTVPDPHCAVRDHDKLIPAWVA